MKPLGVSDKFKGKSKQGFYGDVVMEVDWSVGEVMKALKSNGKLDNTLVIFTSDNGPWLNYGDHAGSTGGFREGKGTSWEGGQRVPGVISWPETIEPGSITNRLSSTIDILPTIASIAGASLPDEKIDGVDLSAILKGDEDAIPRNKFYFYYHRNDLEAVRKDNWKLVLPHNYRSYEGVAPGKDGWPGPYGRGTTDLGLYDLRRDPGERYNLIDEHPDIVKNLMTIVEEARNDLGDNLTDRVGQNVRQAGWLGDPPIKRVLNEAHLAQGKTVKYLTSYSERFTSGGNDGLTDGILGSAVDFNRSWQGWHGDDLEIIIDLGLNTQITSIGTSFLRNHGSWIFLPSSVTYSISSDGKTFELIGSGEFTSVPDDNGTLVKEHVVTWTGNTRFIKVTAKNIGLLPEWHAGANEKGWLFLDEVIVR